MALIGVAPLEMRPIALGLNVIVASVAFWRYRAAGEFSPRLFAILAVASVPAAFAGGRIDLTAGTYTVVLGLVLLAAAASLMLFRGRDDLPVRRSPLEQAVSGGAIGMLSGFTGIGGGVFLTPLMILRRWCRPRTAAGVSAAFIVVNSIAGLAGQWSRVGSLPWEVIIYALAVAAGGLLGSTLGVARLDSARLRTVLALVITIAGLRMLFSSTG